MLPIVLLIAVLGARPIQLTGTASMYGEYGLVTGDTLVKPRPELRLNLRPTLSIYRIPFGLDILLSTQESNLRQQLDKFKLFLNPQKWLQSQTDLSGFAVSLKGLELGSCNPSWTPLTLSGAPVLGGAVELNPWYVYAAAAGGRNQRRVQVSDSTQGAFSRMLYSGRFGFGKKEGTHFFLTALYAADDTTPPDNNRQPNPNDTEPPIDSFEVVRPQENYVVGAEFVADANDGQARLEAEVTGCEVTRDRRLPVERWNKMPDWMENTFHPRLSSSVDYAFKVRSVVTWLGTQLHGKVEMVGPGYQSLGAPGLRNDNFAVGAGVSGNYFDNAVSIAGSFTRENDNLLRANATNDSGRVVRVLTLKSQTTRFTSWEASLGLTIPNLPYLQVGYYPYTQASDSLDSLAEAVSTTTSTGRVVSVSVGHSFQTGKLSHSPGASFSYNDLRGDDPAGNNTSWDAGLNYGLGFESPLSMSASCGYSRSEAVGTEPDARLYFDVTPSYTLFNAWRNSLSLGATLGSSTRVDTRLTSSFPVWKICDGRVGVANAIYSGDDGKYNDLRLTAQLSKSW